MRLSGAARDVFLAKCVECHSPAATGTKANKARKEIADIADLSLVRRKVDLGHPEQSAVWKVIAATDPDDRMPPDAAKNGPLTSEQIEAVHQWVLAGAPLLADESSARHFITDVDMIDSISTDLGKLTPNRRLTARYFTLTNLYNISGDEQRVSDAELQLYREGLAKALNSLSTQPRIVKPIPVNGEGTIFRVDIRDLGWDERTWDRIATRNPYVISYDNSNPVAVKFAGIVSLTKTTTPFVRADWFVSDATQPPLYHELLSIPQTAADLEATLKVSVARNIAGGNAARAGFTHSKVSLNNRVIERHDMASGAYWKSYDFRSSRDREDVLANPLGPGGGPHQFKQSGGEFIYSLPNGMQAFMIVNAEGNRLDKAPVEIVQDSARPDAAVVNGVSCMSCHPAGANLATDEVLGHVSRTTRNQFTDSEFDAIQDLYRKPDEFGRLLDGDRARFVTALKEAGVTVDGGSPSRLGREGEPVQRLVDRFAAPLHTLTELAAEVGLPRADLARRIEQEQALRDVRSRLQQSGGVPRDQFLDVFRLVVKDLGIGDVRVPAGTRPELVPAAGHEASPALSPLEVVIHLDEAIEKGDVKAIEEACDPEGESPVDPKTIHAMAQVVASLRDLRLAVAEQYGAEAAKDPRLFPRVFGDPATLRKLEVTTAGHHAAVVLLRAADGSPASTIPLREVNGRWLVRASSVMSMEFPYGYEPGSLSVLVGKLALTQANVQAGKYDTLERAWDALKNEYSRYAYNRGQFPLVP